MLIRFSSLHFPFRITGRKQLTVPDAKVHGLCGPNHPNGQEHVVADLSCLQRVDQKEERAVLLCVYVCVCVYIMRRFEDNMKYRM